MPTSKSIIVAIASAVALTFGAVNAAQTQDQLDLNSLFGGGETEVSNENLLAALEEAADAGQPIRFVAFGCHV